MKTKAVCLSCILTALVCARPAHAAVVMTLEQVGPNVAATGTGTLDVAGLTPFGSAIFGPEIVPNEAILLEGNGGSFDFYRGISGPSNFGPGSAAATTGSGDPLAIYYGGGRAIIVPHHYVSGTPLSSTATFDNTTLAALGVTTGTYTWTWGSVAAGDADSLTLYAGVPVPVPEPAPALLLTLGTAALVLLKRIKK